MEFVAGERTPLLAFGPKSVPFVAYSLSVSVSPSVSSFQGSVANPSEPSFSSSLSLRPSPSVSARLGSVWTAN